MKKTLITAPGYYTTLSVNTWATFKTPKITPSKPRTCSPDDRTIQNLHILSRDGQDGFVTAFLLRTYTGGAQLRTLAANRRNCGPYFTSLGGFNHDREH